MRIIEAWPILKYRYAERSGNMVYGQSEETYCGSWTIRWNFHMEPFTRDGESSGFGRFVGLADGVAVVQLWIIDDVLKIEHEPGYAVQLNTSEKVITVLQKESSTE